MDFGNLESGGGRESIIIYRYVGHCAILREMPKCTDLVQDIGRNWSLSARNNRTLGCDVSVYNLEILNGTGK